MFGINDKNNVFVINISVINVNINDKLTTKINVFVINICH